MRRSFDRLDRLLCSQAYRLAYWRRASQEINYRRFFDINELVGIRIDNPKVFEARHAPVFRLMKEGAVDALRIDHIDGLRDPYDYLSTLRKRIDESVLPKMAGRNRTSWWRKIISGSEALPSEWPVAGTTGYDFVNARKSCCWSNQRATAISSGSISDLRETQIPLRKHGIYAKKQVIEQLFGGEMRSLSGRIVRLALMDRRACDLPFARSSDGSQGDHSVARRLSHLRSGPTNLQARSTGTWNVPSKRRRARAEKNQITREVFAFFRRLFPPRTR